MNEGRRVSRMRILLAAVILGAAVATSPAGAAQAADPTPVPTATTEQPSPWALPATLGAALLAALVALRAARIQMTQRAARRTDPPPED